MIKIPRILHLEDDKNDAELARRELERAGLECHMVTVANQDQFSQALENGPYDLVLSDSRIVGLDATRAHQRALERLGDVPFVCLSGSSREDALGAGMTLVLKSDLERLPGVVRQALSLTPALPRTNDAARLVEVVQRLSLARDLDTLMSIVRKAARDLTGADGATFVLRDGDQCHYADEDAIAPLWKGRRFPLEACISGWAMQNRQAVVIEDIYADPRIPADAYRPTFVQSLAMVPIRRLDPVGAIGNYWAQRHRPTPEQLDLLQALADTTAVALENVSLLQDLESRVEQRTADLAAANRELEAFSRAISHDLRSPLRSISGFTRMAIEEGQCNETARGYLERVERSSGRMNEMIDAMLSLSMATLAPLERRPADLARLAREIAQELQQREPGRPVSWEIPSALPVEGDPRLLRQVLENLLSNAFKFTSKKSCAEIQVGFLDGAYFVRDNGAGFDTARAARLFEPFQRLHTQEDFPGHGVGLSTVKRIVGRHGGRIWVDSEPERGTTFWFTLG